MNVEEQLIKKAYFEEMIENSTTTDHPFQILSELYLEENKKEVADFSYIRFAQGEVYFHYKDYEAAIFKWENIHNELGPWAKKNMADAYLELGMPETAEGIYLSIEEASTPLKMETNLQLLSIYIEQGRMDKAIEIIQSAVALDPDYPEITEIARNFYEEHKEWNYAVSLALDEAVRTGSLNWFAILEGYITTGQTVGKHPMYFNHAITTLFSINLSRFEQFVDAIWNQYKGREEYLDWLNNFNTLFLDMEVNSEDSWRLLSNQYQEAYFELINGTHFIKELTRMIPQHLGNWLKITNSSTALFASAAVMAWSERFPSTVPSTVVRNAEEMILNAEKYPMAKEDSLQLFQTVLEWAEENGIESGNLIKWNIEELAHQKFHHLLLAGISNSSKEDFINVLLGDDILSGPTSSIIAFKHGEETEIKEVTDTEMTKIENNEQFQQAIGVRRQNVKKDTIIDFTFPNEFIRLNQLKMIDLPEIQHHQIGNHTIYQYIHFADSMLFFINAEQGLTDNDKEVLKQVSIQVPNLPIHFVLMKLETLTNDEESKVIDKTLSRIQVYCPEAKLFIYSTHNRKDKVIRDFTEFLHPTLNNGITLDERVTKLQHFVRKSIHYLLDKRLEMETNLIESVRWNEEMSTKLNGAINQIHDLEDEKKRTIKDEYNLIQDEVRKEILKSVPNILRSSSEIIKEDSDFSKIHIKLNEEMNSRIQDYLEGTVLKKYYRELNKWIAQSKAEFDQAQYTLDEMCEGFNVMYGEEKLKQQCDFKILDDWQRDADRMTSGIQLEKMNFLLRYTPAQVFLKSAGKLFAVMPQNNAMLYNKYKSYIENENYSEAAETIADKFFKQFEMFEKSLGRDVTLFFKEPLRILNGAVDESHQHIETSKAELEKMRVKPEVYRDPLNLFEVQLRQYEWMAAAGKQQ
ncbi:GTP-binding protein [Mesobacillus maritimus]|uniref:GTP-binding protein n=1 Tax=Mesobacillus maritimus TaxID=1643336 RepID=A0ABS7K9K1_9BACI|nr:GTP-binding protein [Mesobacillus maritimus]MBY0098946.1 GTP-binding protein [Mesobacillus maritimus]